jgi:hypothetical protein
MPYKLRKLPNKDEYKVFNSETGKVHSKHATKVNAKKQIKMLHSYDKMGGAMANDLERVGMGLSNKQTKDFIKAGYEKKKNVKEIDGYKLDKSISTKRSKVYVNPEGQAVVTHAGTDSATDWLNNPATLIPSLYKKQDRYKEAEKVQKKANAKYNKENIETVSHSQSGQIANIMADKGLTAKGASTTVNPAIFGKPSKGVKVIKSSGDVVSALTKTRKNDEVIKAKSFNPLTEHSPDILGGMCCMCRKKIGGMMAQEPNETAIVIEHLNSMSIPNDFKDYILQQIERDEDGFVNTFAEAIINDNLQQLYTQFAEDYHDSLIIDLEGMTEGVKGINKIARKAFIEHLQSAPIERLVQLINTPDNILKNIVNGYK